MRARELMNLPGVAWNAGMFAWRRRAIREALEKYTPLMMLIDQATSSDLALAAAYDRISPISIDHAVMEGAAADHRVVMGSMDVGWSDLGSWTALLAALAGGDARGATGRVVQSGETIEVGADDLLIRQANGRLAVEAAGEGRIVADSVWAHLARARHLTAQVQALLDRVVHQEERA
jgi:mannose-1-phosphate guanylyltransferase